MPPKAASKKKPQTLVVHGEEKGAAAADADIENLVTQFGDGFRTPSPMSVTSAEAPRGKSPKRGKKSRRGLSSSARSDRSWGGRISALKHQNSNSWNTRLFSPFRHHRYHPWKSLAEAAGGLWPSRFCTYCAQLGPSEEFYDKNPRQGVLFSTLIYALPIGGAVLVIMATEAAISTKGILLIACFAAIRDSTAALGSLFSFFWFFEMSATGKLVAENNWSAVGGHMALSGITSLACGIAASLTLVFLAETFLTFASPVQDRDAILDIAVTATKIAAASVPFAVFNFAAGGLLLGAKQIAKTVGSMFFWGVITAISIIVALFRLDCTEEEQVNCPPDIVAQLDSGAIGDADCVLSYEDDGFVCPHYKGFLTTCAAVLAFSSLGVALTLFIGEVSLISPHRVNFKKAMSSKDVQDEWGRDTSWVAVRSIVGNSRHFIALFFALRIGIAETAAWIMFGSVSQIAYAIPSNLASVAMITISRLIGRGEYKSADLVLDDYRSFGFCCGALFAIVAAFSKDGLIDSYARESERDQLYNVISPLWYWLVAYQPARSLVAVYQALVAGSQAFEYWGKATVVATVVCFVPTVTIAAVYKSIDMLIIGEVLYTYVLFGMLYARVHWLKEHHKTEDEDIVEDLSEDEFYGIGKYAPDAQKETVHSDSESEQDDESDEEAPNGKKNHALEAVLQDEDDSLDGTPTATAEKKRKDSL